MNSRWVLNKQLESKLDLFQLVCFHRQCKAMWNNNNTRMFNVLDIRRVLEVDLSRASVLLDWCQSTLEVDVYITDRGTFSFEGVYGATLFDYRGMNISSREQFFNEMDRLGYEDVRFLIKEEVCA